MLDREPLDVAAALQRIGGDKDLLREIAELCLEEYPKLLVRYGGNGGRRAKGLEQGARISERGGIELRRGAAREAAFTLELNGRSGNLRAPLRR